MRSLRAPDSRPRAGRDAAVAVALEQVELELDRHDRRVAALLQPCDRAREHVAWVGLGRPAVQLEHRAEHLRRGPRQPAGASQRARHRAAALVGIAHRPDEAGVLDVLAGDVEPEDRSGDVAAAAVERVQLLARDVLAAPDAVQVGDHQLHGLDVGVPLEERARFVGAAQAVRRR